VFKHILLATDLRTSERAHETAAALAATSGARLTVVHVYEPPAFALAGSMLTGADLVGPCSGGAQPDLERLLWGLRKGGVLAEAVVRCGVPWEQIVGVAREIGADLIVTGTRGRRGIVHAFTGSVAEKIVQEARVPVLAVPHRRRVRLGRARLVTGVFSGAAGTT
jgi:nucleotide-binding universal stress UspA family protein